MICRGCQNFQGDIINNYNRVGRGRTIRTKCEQPFHSKKETHPYNAKREMYINTTHYIASKNAIARMNTPLGARQPSESSEQAVANDSRSSTTPSRPPLAAIDENANEQQRRRPRPSRSERLSNAVLHGSDSELVATIVLLAQDVEEDGAETTTTTMTSEESSRKRSYEHSMRSETIGQHTIENIPGIVKLVLGNRLSKLEREAAEGRRLKAALSNGKFNWSPEACYFLGCGISQMPKGSQYALERGLPFIYKALFVQAKVPLRNDKLSTSTPKSKKIGELVTYAAATIMTTMQGMIIKAKNVCLASDKGHRHGINHMVKIVSFWNVDDDRVETHQLDIDGCGGTSAAGASAIEAATKTSYGGVIKEFGSSTTDAGGAATGKSFVDEMRPLGLVSEYNFFTATCALHALQLGFRLGIEQSLGPGSLKNQNAMQLLHSLSDLQKQFPNEEFKLSWNIAQLDEEFDELCDEIVEAGLAPNRVSAAVLTRWWWVNQAALHLKANWDGWKKYAVACLKSTTSDTYVGQVASSIIQMMGEHRIKCDIWFMNAYSDAYFVKNFKWLQSYDAIAKDYGFLSRHMAVRSFLMIGELEELEANWETHPAFKEYIALVKELPETVDIDESAEIRTEHSQEHCRDFVASFFKINIASTRKHFDQWRSPNLAVMALAGDNAELCTAIADWTLHDLLPIDKEKTVVLPEHGNVTVNLYDVVEFLSEMTTSTEMKSHVMVQENLVGVQKMTRGEHLWSSEDPSVLKLALWAKTYIVPVMHHTHRVEAGVGNASHCALTKRSEFMRSRYAFITTELNALVQRRLFKEEYGRERRANQHMSGGVIGTREHKSEPSKKKHKASHETPAEGNATLNVGTTAGGSLRSKHLLDEVESHLDIVVNENEAIKQQVALFKTEKFSEKRVAKKMGDFAKAQQKSERAPNARQKKVGVTMPAVARKRVPLGRNLPAAMYRQAITDECIARGIDLQGETNYNTLVKKLREWLEANGEDKKSFKPLTSHFDSYYDNST